MQIAAVGMVYIPTRGFLSFKYINESKSLTELFNTEARLQKVHKNLRNYFTQFNVAFINITPLRAREKGNHAIIGIFGTAVTVLLTALQLRYQAKNVSPFQEHPKAMAIAIASFLIFCLVCDAEQYLQATCRSSTSAALFHHVLRLLGFISLASLAFVIFSISTSPTTLLIVYLMIPCFFSARLVLHWIQNRTLHENRGAYNFHNLHPHFVYSSYFNYIDTLPVYLRASANAL